MRFSRKKRLAEAEPPVTVAPTAPAIGIAPALPRLDPLAERSEDEAFERAHQADRARAVALMAARDPLSDPDPKYKFSAEPTFAGDAIAKEFGLGFDGDAGFTIERPRHAQETTWKQVTHAR